jgi:hypothetical protein
MNTRFIGEPITVEFDKEPTFSKKRTCPNRIVWGKETLAILNLLEEWRDYGRRGRMAQNMRPENIKKAMKRGSWGVGRYFFRVQLANGRVFDIYYDRAPKSSDERMGSWHVYQEVFLGGTIPGKQ